MYAIEFETDIKDGFIEIKDHEKLLNKHVRVIVLAEDMHFDNSASKNTEILKDFFKHRQNMPTIDPSIDIIKLCDEINDDHLF